MYSKVDSLVKLLDSLAFSASLDSFKLSLFVDLAADKPCVNLSDQAQNRNCITKH